VTVGALFAVGVLDGAVAVVVAAPLPQAQNGTMARQTSAAGAHVRIIISNLPGRTRCVTRQL
jgi:hypothetical protein